MKLLLTPLALCMVFILPPAQADIINDCEQILEDAQQVYPEFFPFNAETQFTEKWCYRKYDNIYAGIYLSMDGEYLFEGVYALGGVFGNTPFYIDQIESVFVLLNSQLDGGNADQTALCNNNGIPEGFIYTRDGDITTVSTQGQCIELPDTQTICEPFPDATEDGQAIATGIHALSENFISEFELTGVDVVIPGIPDIGELLQQEIIDDQQCTIHVPAEFIQHQVNTDICMDLTDQLGQFASFPGITPPVTLSFSGNTNATRVDDCFKTNASTIVDLVTGELWINQNGSFVEVSE